MILGFHSVVDEDTMSGSQSARRHIPEDHALHERYGKLSV
jgi:hypothetical protein